MPRLIWTLFFCYLLSGPAAFAQTIVLQGTVLDQTTQAPVPFATLGIKDKPYGSVANEQGVFRFTLPTNQLAADEQLLITCVGYEPARVAVAAFQSGAQTVRLKPTAVRLGEVMVRGGKVQTKTFGRTGASTFMVARMYTEPSLVSDELAKEQGTVLAIDPDVLLQDANFFVAFNRFKSVKFRLLLYSVKDGLPDRPLLHDNILLDVTQPRGWVKVDLRPYHIALRGLKEVAVTLQWLHSEAREGSDKAFGLAAVPTPGHSILFRDKSQARWQEVKPGNLSLHLTADSYKAPKKGPSPTAMTEDSSYNHDFSRLLPKAADPPSSHHYGDSAAVGRYVPVRGATIYCEQYGQGEPLLLLHGNGQSIRYFNQQIGELARHFRVVAVDTRAQGRSIDATTAPLSYTLFADDMRQLLDSLHLKQVNILGWSDGGNTALEMAIHYPGYVRRIAVMGANLFPTAQALEPDALALIRQQLALIEPQTDAASVKQARLFRLLLQEPHMSFAALKKVTTPTLVMAGEHDLVLEAHTKAIAASLPHGQLLIFKGATHNAPQEIPQEFNRQVTEFLLKK